ncbi:sigma-70 family RNA polymerase sigma factor [Actinomadura nitritigenes]|uniref:sigma-70 family RNA polymerase sigma factor n=1 Tax=Actinomadura nitritigenes TaxID=134602 RepID=UPI003D901995
MVTVESGDDRSDTADAFRSRNDGLFARRKQLQERIAELRAQIDAGATDTFSELALRKSELEFEHLTCEILITNYGLVRGYVALFTSTSTEHREDFESAGKVGLLRAISSYEPARGLFSSWAFKPIQREILRAVRDAYHPNLNVADFEKRPAILAAERAFLEDKGTDTPVDYADIAGRAGASEAQVRRVLAPPRLESLQSSPGGQDEAAGPWEDRLTDVSPSLEEEVLVRSYLSVIVGKGLPSLDARARYVLTRRFGLDGEPEQSLRAIGDRIGLSREGVRQIEQKALAQLKDPFADVV